MITSRSIAPRLRRGLVLRAVLAAAMVIVVVTLPAQAGFDWGRGKDPGRYRGRALTGGDTDPPTGETLAVQCGIDAIAAMAMNDPSARNRTTLARIAACLQDMLDKGRMCAETVNTGIKGANLAENPPKCTWTGDKMNFAPDCLSKDEPALSQLIAVLVHEGSHAIQWPDGTGLADTETQEEWVAHAWETYILCRRLDEKELTKEQSAEIEARKNFVKWRRDQLCDKSLTDDERDKKLKECSSKAVGTTEPPAEYDQKPSDSSVIRIERGADSFEINTPFSRTFGYSIGDGPLGNNCCESHPIPGCNDAVCQATVCAIDSFCCTGEWDDICADLALQHCGGACTDGDALLVVGEMGTGGGLALYLDVDGDGLPDESSEQFLSLNDPVSVSYVGRDYWVLDRAGGVLWRGEDPFTGLNMFPFALADAFFESMSTVRGLIREPGDPLAAIVSRFSDAYSSRDVISVEHLLTDTNNNGQSDLMEPQGWQEQILRYVPTFVGDAQQGDNVVYAAGLSGHLLSVHITDEEITFLGPLLGQHLVTPAEHAAEVAIELSQPLNAGQHIVVVDPATAPMHERRATLVAPARPEILSTDLARYFPGDTVQVAGRRFGAGAEVLLSGEPVALTGASSVAGVDLLFFTAPNLLNAPTNLFVLEVVDALGNVSNIAGIEIASDCNDNGIDDQDDLASGVLTDADDDGIPDECGCTGDTNGDFVVNVDDLVQVIIGWGCTNPPGPCPADVTGDGVVNVDDLVAVIVAWGDC